MTKIQIYRGMYKQWEAIATTVSDGAVKDISSGKLTFSVKSVKEDLDEIPIIKRENTAAKGEESTEIVFTTDGIDGKYQVSLVPSNTKELIRDIYYYSVKLEISADEPKIIASGVFEILAHSNA
jgi:hypothetical protein